MSLHHVAQHLKTQGRGPDDQLIHMSGKEVAGLQALAEAHGGSLTVNPHTGLPEAGFLQSILPALIGVGATIATGGAAAPWMIGAGIGGIEALRTHDLGKGIMAGLGAYGGAGLGAGLVTAGAQEVAGQTLAKEAAAQAAQEGTALASDYAQMAGQTATPAQIEAAKQGMSTFDAMGKGVGSIQSGGFNAAQSAMQTAGGPSLTRAGLSASAPVVMDLLHEERNQPSAGNTGMIRPYTFAANKQTPQNMVGTKYQPGQDTSERIWFQPEYTALEPYKAAEGGLMSFAGGGPVEQMSDANAIGANTGYPMANLHQGAYSTPWQTPISENVVEGTADTGVNRMTGEQMFAGGGLSSLAKSYVGDDVMPMDKEEEHMAAGGISSLGSYSDGGRLLKGPGDGMSDNIPAQIGDKQPARLADGEFVVPADVVSHLGNGSTDAGAKQLYSMMDKIRQARTGRKSQGKQINPNKFMPA